VLKALDRGGTVRLVFYLVLFLPFWLFGEDYRADSLKLTDIVREFVAKHQIGGSDLEIVHKIIEITHDPFLFIKIERPMLKAWIRDPTLIETFQTDLSMKEKRLAELDKLRLKRILVEKEYQERLKLMRDIFFGNHNLRICENLFKHKQMSPEDLAFVVSGSEAIQHQVRDGCTTMTHLFITLAKAAGLKDVRFVVGANVSEFREACPCLSQGRISDVEIDGHIVALVKIDGKWALVNSTYFEPYSLDNNTRYEILTSFEGNGIRPEELRGKVLRLPSFQKENFPPSELLIAGVGKDSDDDLEVENHTALMNLSVSGDPRDPTCRWTLPEKK
jgi:hypothetical protein